MNFLEEVGAEWTPDCCGKQDFDAALLSLSCRYYPRGGGIMNVTRTGNVFDFQTNSDTTIRPSAICAIVWGGGTLELTTQEFEADTEEEVKALVEAWAAQQVQMFRGLVSFPQLSKAEGKK